MSSNLKKITQPVLAANWKLNKTRSEVQSFAKEFENSDISKLDVLVAASPTLLETTVEAFSRSSVKVFAQNIAWSDSGAFTGEVSPAQLSDIGVDGAIVGHSERRHVFHETSSEVADRALNAIKHGLSVVFCVGERLEDREASKTNQVLKTQCEPFLSKLSKLAGLDKCQVWIAYEPVWAIGTGRVAESQQVQEAHAYLSELLAGYNLDFPVIYGGSVKSNNIKELAEVPKVSGFLVGGASLEAKDFKSLVDCLTIA